MSVDFDAIVIGSGFGGAITGCRLAEKGYTVLILERGRRWDKNTFPSVTNKDWLWDPHCPEQCNGWLDLRRFPHMAVAQGAGVGGGSLIYANISCEAPPHVFTRGWPPEITYAELKPHYDAVKKFMNVRELPDGQLTDRARLMRLAAEKIGQPQRFRKLELAVSFDENWSYSLDDPHSPAHSKPFVNQHGASQGTCTHLGYCDVGCPVLAKNTLDLNYLYLAENRHGAEIRSMHLVTAVEPADGGYRVTFDRIEGGRRARGSQTARVVIVAAGSLGSTELLLRCRDLHKTLPDVSQRLGHGWSSNGDFLTPAIGTKYPCSPTRGPTITAAIDFHDGSQCDRAGRPMYYWIEDGGFPEVALPHLVGNADKVLKFFGAKELIDGLHTSLRGLNTWADVMPWFAQGIDAADGRMRLRKRWWLFGPHQLSLRWDIAKSEQVMDAIIDMQEKLARATGGFPLVPPSWRWRDSWLNWVARRFGRNLVTPHPLGGCNMGQSRETGVVDHAGEVFGYRNLYVADAAVIPEAIGVNPSRTIGALAERTAALIAAQGR